MSQCRTCKFWFRGVITHVDPESKNWDGSPHSDAGKRIVSRHWAGTLSAGAIGNTGECRAGAATYQAPIFAVDAGPLISFGYYGCCMWGHDDRSDKFDHHFVKYAGQESLEQAIAAVKEDTEKFEEEIPTDSTVMVRFFMKDGETWLEYDERVGPASHQLTHVVRPASGHDTRVYKDKYVDFCNSMY